MQMQMQSETLEKRNFEETYGYVTYEINTNEEECNKIKMHGNEINILNFKGFKLEKNKDNLKQKALNLVCNSEYDFVSFYSTINVTKYYVHKSESTYCHVYNLSLNLEDTISNIKIIGQMLQKIDTNDISFACILNITNKLETFNCVVEKINKENDNLLLSSKDNEHYNELCSNSLSLTINTKSENKPFEITNIEYQSYLWSSEIRNKFAQEGKVHIDLSKII
jgi:hypothetical protein